MHGYMDTAPGDHVAKENIYFSRTLPLYRTIIMTLRRMQHIDCTQMITMIIQLFPRTWKRPLAVAVHASINHEKRKFGLRDYNSR